MPDLQDVTTEETDEVLRVGQAGAADLTEPKAADDGGGSGWGHGTIKRTPQQPAPPRSELDRTDDQALSG